MPKPLRYIVAEWKEQYGEEKVPESGVRYKFIPKETRQDLLEILVETVIKEGLASSRKYFEINERIIVEACVNKNSKYKDSLKKMTAASKDDLEKAVTRVYMRLKLEEEFGEEEAPPARFSEDELSAPAKSVREEPKNEPEEDDYDEQTLSEHQLRILNKKPVAPTVDSSQPEIQPVAPKIDPNNEIYGFLGIDPKEFGYTNE